MSYPTNPPAPRFITLPFREEYLTLLWQDKEVNERAGAPQHEWGEVSYNVANLIRTIDPKSEYVHIEWPEDADTEGLKLPRIWRIERWLLAHERYLKVKAASERDRKRSNIMNEDIHKVSITLGWKCAMTEENALSMATKIVTMRATEMCELLCGYKLRKLEGE